MFSNSHARKKRKHFSWWNLLRNQCYQPYLLSVPTLQSKQSLFSKFQHLLNLWCDTSLQVLATKTNQSWWHCQKLWQFENLLPVRLGNPGNVESYGKMVKPYILADPSHLNACIFWQSGHLGPGGQRSSKLTWSGGSSPNTVGLYPPMTGGGRDELGSLSEN